MATLEVDGATLGYEEEGQGAAIVFSHGFLMDRTMFSPQIAALKDRYRCISWEQRGFGETGDVSQAFDYWTSARDLIALLDHLSVDQAVLIGLSQGGFLSMRAALIAPKRMRGLVLVSTRSGLDSDETVNSFRQLRAEWATNGSANVAEMLGEVLIGRPDLAAPWKQKWGTMSRNALAHPIDALTGRDDLTPRLGEITCPVMVIHGDADNAISITHGEALARDLNAIEFVGIAGAGHCPPLTHADEVTAAIERYLSSI